MNLVYLHFLLLSFFLSFAFKLIDAFKVSLACGQDKQAVRSWVCIYIYVCMQAHTYTHACVCTSPSPQHTHARTHACTHAHMHACMHTHTHAHTHRAANILVNTKPLKLKVMNVFSDYYYYYHQDIPPTKIRLPLI